MRNLHCAPSRSPCAYYCGRVGGGGGVGGRHGGRHGKMRKIMWFVCFCRMLLCHKMGCQITKIKRNMFPPPARPAVQPTGTPQPLTAETKQCVFRCSENAQDAIEHYARCPCVQQFAAKVCANASAFSFASERHRPPLALFTVVGAVVGIDVRRIVVFHVLPSSSLSAM